MAISGLRVVITIAMLALLAAGGAEARVEAVIDKTRQVMVVRIDGAIAHVWPVSTARRGYVTPSGAFRPRRLERIWYSSKYDDAPMPYSIFFLGGYAVHGTTDARNLGRPASHGCVRLAIPNARRLFDLVRAHGPANSAIIVR
jgi:lipoprotein-anchoring transpeptidase ErfK/SrfK